MDATHLHLALTHFPIVGTFIGAVILVYGIVLKNNAIKKLALILFILMALLTIPVFLTGEEAEETVEKIAGISEHLIEEHEELAEKAIWLMGVLAIFSLLNIYAILKNKHFTKTITIITLFFSIITFGAFANVGNLGGQIRHSEIRSNSSSIQQESDSNQIKDYKDDDDDD